MTASLYNNPIVLVCAADDNYAMPLAVTVRSALANLMNDRKVALYILDGGIRERNRQKIQQSFNPEQISITWIQPDPQKFEHLRLDRYLTIASYFRLLLPELIPVSVKKAIYLDTDMVVEGDLEQLWQIEINDCHVLAVQDDVEQYISMAEGLKNIRSLATPADAKYFNSGLLVINLEKWRSENIGHQVLEFVRQNSTEARHDQDGLNAVLAGKWCELDPRWNQMPKIYEYASWKESPYSEEVYRAVLQKPYIIHFTNSPKPWCAGLKAQCTHPQKNRFYTYLDMTAWAGWRDDFWRRLGRKVSKLTGQYRSKL